MSRGRQRKTYKGNFPEYQMKNVVWKVIEENLSLREAVERNELTFQTLARYVMRRKENSYMIMTPKCKSR